MSKASIVKDDMKLLQYPSHNVHHKNMQSMERMCKALQIIYEVTDSVERLHDLDYTILWLPSLWISPAKLPGVKILFGPHHWVFPSGDILGAPNEEWSSRCAYTVLSPWVADLFSEFAEESVIPFQPLPFGIQALPHRSFIDCSLDCIVYVKNRDPNTVNDVIQKVQDRGLKYEVFRYGSYQDSEYQKAISCSKFAIWVGRHESQGFAFQECMARNLPILLCDVCTMFDEWGCYEHLRGSKKLKATAASWWDDCCGERIEDVANFDRALDKVQDQLHKYTPAAFVEANLSDESCMRRILETLGIPQESQSQ